MILEASFQRCREDLLEVAWVPMEKLPAKEPALTQGPLFHFISINYITMSFLLLLFIVIIVNPLLSLKLSSVPQGPTLRGCRRLADGAG